MPIIDQIDSTNGSPLSLRGEQGPNFENESQRATSTIQAFVEGGTLTNSQDLLDGRSIGGLFCPPSNPPVSFPDSSVGRWFYPSLGGPYNINGPEDGRY